MGKYFRNLVPAGVITKDSLIAISEETTDESFKTPIGKAISVGIDYLILSAQSGQTSVGAITLDGDTALIGNAGDYAALEVGGWIKTGGTTEYYITIVSKLGYPNIEIYPTDLPLYPANNFLFGSPQLAVLGEDDNAEVVFNSLVSYFDKDAFVLRSNEVEIKGLGALSSFVVEYDTVSVTSEAVTIEGAPTLNFLADTLNIVNTDTMTITSPDFKFADGTTHNSGVNSTYNISDSTVSFDTASVVINNSSVVSDGRITANELSSESTDLGTGTEHYTYYNDDISNTIVHSAVTTMVGSDKVVVSNNNNNFLYVGRKVYSEGQLGVNAMDTGGATAPTINYLLQQQGQTLPSNVRGVTKIFDYDNCAVKWKEGAAASTFIRVKASVSFQSTGATLNRQPSIFLGLADQPNSQFISYFLGYSYFGTAVADVTYPWLTLNIERIIMYDGFTESLPWIHISAASTRPPATRSLDIREIFFSVEFIGAKHYV